MHCWLFYYSSLLAANSRHDFIRKMKNEQLNFLQTSQSCLHHLCTVSCVFCIESSCALWLVDTFAVTLTLTLKVSAALHWTVLVVSAACVSVS